ncbi:MAG: amidohydrolase family protein [Candidatus Obscuribacterales bacterium]|nr:amidohydrolase family protein [Candidatus Obscuribacterales bacterium]
MVAIFDSLVHPTVTGVSLSGKEDASVETLVRDMKRHNFIGACAVGLAGIQNYEHEAFLRLCSPYPELVPIAGFNPDSDWSELDSIKKLGFAGIKIHLRLAEKAVSSQRLGDIFREANARNLIVFYCTYMHGKIASYPEEDPFYFLVKALKAAPKAKVVLLHGGNIELMRYSELARFNENLLLDLSFTMIKYAGSSLDQDIKFLMNNLDRRLCVGSDHPEYDHEKMRKRFELLTEDLPVEKLENIAFKNLVNFLKPKN